VPRPRRLAALAALAVLVVGCRLDVVADAELRRDGGGRVGLLFELDPALLDELDALGVDPTAELGAVGSADGWSLARQPTGEDGLVLLLEREVADPSAIGAAYRELVAGLAPEDPALLVDLDVTRTADGSSRVAGTATFRPPSTAGASLDGEPIGPSAERLAALTAETVQPRLVVTLPGGVREHDGDSVSGRTITWWVPIGEERPVTAVAAPPAWYTHPWVVPLAGAAVGLVVLLLLAWSWRRRRR
jgi:hypothetical protein